MPRGIETDRERLQHPATMTREQIVDGLRREKMRAQSAALFLQKAIDELADDKHANWGEADAAVWFAIGDAEQLAAFSPGKPNPSAPTLRNLWIETGRHAVNAAGPDGGRLIPREIADSLMANEFRKPDGDVIS